MLEFSLGIKLKSQQWIKIFRKWKKIQNVVIRNGKTFPQFKWKIERKWNNEVKFR